MVKVTSIHLKCCTHYLSRAGYLEALATLNAVQSPLTDLLHQQASSVCPCAAGTSWAGLCQCRSTWWPVSQEFIRTDCWCSLSLAPNVFWSALACLFDQICQRAAPSAHYPSICQKKRYNRLILYHLFLCFKW